MPAATIRRFSMMLAQYHGQIFNQQAELDLLVIQDGRRRGFEFKYTDAPRLTRSMHQAIELLRLDDLTIVCPGAAGSTTPGRFPISEIASVASIERLVVESIGSS